MVEKLLNQTEVSRILGVSEGDLKILVDRGEIPAYRLGGSILRFRKDQIDQIKKHGVPKIISAEEDARGYTTESRIESIKDFIYFNDFYIISGVIIAVLLVVIFFY